MVSPRRGNIEQAHTKETAYVRRMLPGPKRVRVEVRQIGQLILYCPLREISLHIIAVISRMKRKRKTEEG